LFAVQRVQVTYYLRVHHQYQTRAQKPFFVLGSKFVQKNIVIRG
jgi:hypothetical protein